jgi:hypothetical protein
LRSSPAIHGSWGGNEVEALVAATNAMSIGFSVPHTSGEKATSRAIPAKATANTTSDPSHSRRRTGSCGGSARAAARCARRRAHQPVAPRRAASARWRAAASAPATATAAAAASTVVVS